MKAITSQISHHLFGLFFCVGIVMAAVTVVPLEGVGFTLPKLLLFGCIATVGSVWLMWQGQLPMLDVLRHHRLGQLWGYFVGIVLLSFSWSTMPIVSALGAAPRFGGALTYAVCFTLAACAVNLCLHQRGRSLLSIAIILSNVLIVMHGFLQLVRLDPLTTLWDADTLLGRTFSVTGQPNALAAFILLTLPFVELRALNLRLSLAERTLYSLFVFLNVIVLLGTASRAGLIGLLVNGLMLAWMAGPAVRKALQAALKHHLILTAICTLFLLATAVFSFAQRFEAPAETALRSIESRALIWQEALTMMWDKPQGYGLDAIGVFSPQYRSAALNELEPLTAIVDRAHSLPLDLWLTLGPLGVITYYLLLAALLRAAWLLRETSGSAAAGGLGLLGYSVVMLVGFESVLTQVFFWIIAGMIIGVTWRLQRGKKRPQPARGVQLAIIVLGIMSTASVVASLQWLRGRTYLARAEMWTQRGQLEFAFQEYANATRAFVYDRETIVRLTENLLHSRETNQSPATAAALDQAITKSIEALEQLTNGYDTTVMLLRGWHAAAQGNVAVMRQALADARKSTPNSLDAHHVALHAFLLAGEQASATQALDRVLELLPQAWQEPTSSAGRIIWKENPWLTEIQALEYSLKPARTQAVPDWETD